MKTKFRRGIALALAIALVITTLSWTAGNTLRASDDEEAYTQETHVAQEAKPEKQEKAEKPQEKPQEQPQVQEKQEISLDENDKADSQPQHADKEDNAAEVSGEEAAEEEAAVEEEVIEEEETVLMPAATFSKTASNGIHVSVSAPEGALPEGTTMSVSAVGKDRALSMIQGEVPDAVDAKGVDITFHYEGKEIEPEKNVKVTLKGANVEGSDFNIYHVEDSGNVELMTSNATSSGGTFKSDEFSVYIIEASAPEEEEEQDTISVTVRFLTTEKVAISDSYSTDVELEDGKYSFSYDGVPSEDGMTPALSGDADGHFSFSGNTIHATIPENEINSEREYTVDIIYSSQPADFTVKYLFQTMDGEGYEEDAAYPAVTVQGEVGHMTNSEASVVEVEGFIAPTEDDIDEQVVAADGSTVVELKYIRNSYRVVYNTNGGSYIPAIKGGYGAEVQLYKKDADIPEKTELACGKDEHKHTYTSASSSLTNKKYYGGCYPASGSKNPNCGKTEHTHSNACYKTTPGQKGAISPLPTRTGYTFAGWYLDAACTQLAPETATLTSDINLYAKWDAQTVNYTVVYFKEVWDNSTNSGHYEFDSSATLSAPVGSTVSGAADKSYDFYTFKSADSATVKADGSTVVGVYYDLTRYTFVFDINKSAASIVANGKTYTGTGYQIKNVVLGMNLSGMWPSLDANAGPLIKQPTSGSSKYFDKWGNSYASLRFEVTSDMLKANGNYQLLSGTTVTYKAQWYDTSTTVNVEYYLQNPDGNGYTKSDVYSQNKVPSTSLSAKQIYGFTNLSTTPTGYTGSNTSSNPKIYRFYYKRNAYTMTFYYKDSKLKEESVLFEANIAGKNYTPSRPATVDEEFTFAGWYDNAECSGDPYPFTVMPGNNVALYAKWAAPEKKVTIDYNYDGKTKVEKVLKGDYLEIATPDRSADGYAFAGWYTAAEGGSEVDIFAPVKEDMIIYAHWTKVETTTYVVNYVTSDGTPIAEPKTKGGKVGKTVVEYAIAPQGEYADYIVDKASESMTLGADSTKNVITFTYSTFADSKYKVQYVNTAGEVVAERKSDVEGNWFEATANRMLIKASNKEVPAGYVLGATTSKWLQVSSDANQNIVKFQVTPVNYTIKYDNVAESWAKDHERTYTINDEVHIATPEKEGYIFTGWDYGPSGVKATVTDHAKEGTVVEKGSHANLVFTANWEVFTVEGYNKPYDAEKHSVTVNASAIEALGFKLTYSVDGGEFTAEKPMFKDVTDHTVTVRATGPLGIIALEKSAKVTITKAPLTVETEGASKVYDGDPLTAPGKIQGFKGGEEATFTVTGSQTVVGSSDNTYTLEFDKTAKAGNYEITSETKGTLTVTQFAEEIVVTTTGGTFTYDGKAHGATVAVSQLPKGYSLVTATSSATATDVTKTDVTATCDTLVIKNAAGDDVTSQLKIRYVDGTIKINPAVLTVSTPNAEKVYDGDALTSEGTISGFVNGETATFTTTGTQTEVGSSSNTYSLNWNDTAKKDNYTVSENLGTLEVTEYAGDITVTTTGGTFQYDGKAHGAAVAVSQLPKGYSLVTASSNDTATHVAEGTVTADCDVLVIRNAAGEDVTANLNIKQVTGSITITKAPLTIVTPSANKVYDGKPLTAKGIDSGAVFEGLVNGETATFLITGSQTEVGTSDNTYTLTWDGTAAATDYTVGATVGSLTVTESEEDIVVTTTGGTFEYDGQAHGATVTVSELPEGYTLETAVSKATATHVAEGKVNANCDVLVIRNAEGKDVTANLREHITFIPGTIEITPQALTVVTGTDSKTYDGTALTAEGSIEGFVGEETATFTVTGSQTAVGQSDNTYSLVFDGSAAATDYTVSDTVGMLTVTEYAEEITVTTTGGTFEYDGKSHGATVAVSALPTGYTLDTATSDDKATHVVEGSVTADCDNLVIKNAAGEDVTSKLNIKYVDGSITITPVTLTVNTPDANKVYDGTALTKAGSIEGFVNEETATFTTTGTQTAVGTSDNTYSLVFDGSAAATDYTVSDTVGKLTVTESAQEILVTVAGGTFTYDGQAHGATVAVTNLPVGYVVETAKSDATATHVSEGTVTAGCDTLVIKNGAGEDVTDKLNIRFVDGSITITPQALTVETPNASKTYDGSALTAEGSISGFVNGETATFTTTGTQTDVGDSDNTYSLVFDGTAAATDYTVSDTIGKLTVTENTQEIVVTTTGGTFTYDGQAHGATVAVSTLPTGYTLETATSDDTATHVSEGTVTADCDTLVIKNAAGEDVTSKLNIKYVDGSITITPVTLTVVTNTESKSYDGTALTAEGSVEGFVNNETATFTVTGTQTDVGTSDNTYTLVFDKTAAETDYTVSDTVGKLTVTENADEIVVTTTGGTFPYDGQTHGATVTVSTLPTGYTVDTATSADTATHVSDGTVTANCDTLVIRNAKGEDVTSKLNIKYVDGSIKITPVTLTVVTSDASKEYDGTALTADGSIEGFVNNENATFATTGTQTVVGESDNTYDLIFDGTADEGDYTVSATVGKLTVTESAQEIVVTVAGGTFTYDGKAHGATVAVSKLPTGYTLEAASSKDSATHVSEGSVTADCDTLVIRNAEGEDVTGKLNIKYVNGTIAITPATLTVVTGTDDKVYDGTALTAEGSIEGFVNNETATFATTGTQTEVGTSDNTYSLAFDKTAAATDYTVSETVGKLTVTENKDEIVVTVAGGTFEYDGQNHGATVTVSTLPLGYTLVEASSDDSARNVGQGTVKANCDTLVIKNAAGEDVTSKLNIKYVDGSITITPATLTVITPDANKVYDGTALTAKGSITGFIGNESADVTLETIGSQTAVGSSANTYKLTWDKTSTTTFESNYVISETIGKLTVTEYAGEITVTVAGGTFEYDGQAHGATVAVSTLPAGYTLETATSDDTATHVFEGTVTADCDTLVIKNAAGENVTDKLNIKYTNGTINITPATLTVVTKSGGKVYDGTALTAEGSIEGFVNNETATFTVTGSRTAVGTSDNTYTLAFDQSAQAEDYTIDETVGKLTVTENASEIVVTTTGGTFTYDGTEHKATVEVSNLPTGYTLVEATSKDKATHVSEGTVTADCDTLVIKNAAGEDVTSKLNIKRVDGSIAIKPVTLTVVTPDAEKTYDGEALTKAGSIEGFVNGEEATFTTTGTQTAVGESKNTYSLVFDGTAEEDDYTVSATVGTLKVTESTAEITVTTTGGEFTYDGKSHGATCEVTGLPKGYTLETATSKAKATHVAEGTVTAGCDTLVIKNAEGEDVTSKLNIKYVDGSITITPATLTVVTEGASKVYDSDPLTASGTIEGFVNDETATFATTGSQTEVGDSNNTYGIQWDGTAKETDYVVDATLGKLVVTQNSSEIVVTTKGGEFTYDGNEHQAVTTISQLPKGYSLFAIGSNDKATHVAEGTVTADCDTLVIKNAAGQDVTDKLNIRYVNDTIKINPAKLTVVTEGSSKVYDGEALTADGSIDGFINNETATFTVTGSQTAVGSSDNTYTLVFDGTAAESDYFVDETVGKLTVTEFAGEITVTTTGGEFTYDGQAHGAKCEVSGLPAGYTLETATSNASATHVAEGTVDADCDTLVIKNAAGEDVTGKLNIKKTPGNIVITPAELTVSTPTDSKVYDGTALAAEGHVTGLVEGETVTFSTTGSQTNVGTSDNTYTLVFDGTAAEDDYTVATEIGTLTVDPIATKITITANDGNKIYDGTALEADGYEFTPDVLVDGDRIVATVVGSITNAGETESTVSEYKIMRGDEDVTKNYASIECVPGKLKVDKRAVTLTSADDSKVYDGKPLTNDNVTVAGDGWAEGEGATYDVTGTITNVGEQANEFTYELSDKTSADNYEITVVPGTLTVTKKSGIVVNIVANSDTVLYDGQLHEVEGYDVTSIKEVVEGQTAKDTDLYSESDFEFAGPAYAGGTDAGTYTMGLTEHNFSNTNDNFENVTFVVTDGVLKINKRTVVMTSATASKIYDGTPLTDSTVKVTGDGWAEGEGATYDVTGSQTEAGTSDNEFTYRLNGQDSSIKLFAAVEGEAESEPEFEELPMDTGANQIQTKPVNYNIQQVFGKLTVSAKGDVVVTITEHSNRVRYDGNEHLVNGYDVSITDPLYTVDDFEFNGDDTIKGTKPGSYDMELTSEDFVNTNKNFENVTFNIVDGQLIIDAIYNLTIHYVDTKGKTLAKDYTGTYIKGEAFRIKSPAIKGYTYDYAVIKSGEDGMPAKDLEFTVTYKANVTPGGGDNGGNGGNTITTGLVTPDGDGGFTITPIEEPQVPAAPADGAWALLNLILTILTCLLSIILLILYFFRKKRDDEEEAKETANAANTEDEDGNDVKRKLVPRLLSAVWAILMIIVFVITEDMSLPMVFVDKWTILMVIMAIIQVIIAVFAKKKYEDDDNEEEPEAVQA